jgi:Protein of unknown function (DUF3379)
MRCEDARLQIGAEPGSTAPALEEHVKSCAACHQFREEMRALDANIRRVLERPPEAGGVVSVGAVRLRPRIRPTAWRQWALAASVTLATFAVLALWLLRPGETLARDVVAHVRAEPDSWLAAQHVDAASINAALRGAGVELNFTSDKITYAHSCWFRGHYVPHLVVQTARGPVTVLILRHESVSRRHEFHEGGMTGVIVPDGAGSLALLARGASSIDDIAGQMQQDVHWLPQGT